MASNKEPTRHQLSSKLAYSSSTPAFLQKLKNQIAGIPNEPEYDDEEDEWEYDGSGRPPIPKRPRERPPIPERPDGDKGSEDEDGDDEKPQVVVLKEGKHLTEREAENVRRKEKGLPPLPDENQLEEASSSTKPGEKDASSKAKAKGPSLSFSSGGASTSKKGSAAKRKAIADLDKDEKDTKSAPQKKKPKKEKKTLLSFGDDA